MISRIPIAAQKKGEAFRPLPAYTENGRLVLEDGKGEVNTPETGKYGQIYSHPLAKKRKLR